MTREEAETVAKIVATADGGCSHCAFALMEKLQAAFPQFEWGTDDETDPDYDAAFAPVITERPAS